MRSEVNAGEFETSMKVVEIEEIEEGRVSNRGVYRNREVNQSAILPNNLTPIALKKNQYAVEEFDTDQDGNQPNMQSPFR